MKYSCIFTALLLLSLTDLPAQLSTIDYPRPSLEGAAVATDSLAFFGGGFRNGAVSINDVNIYNPATGEWTLTRFSEGRNLPAAATASGKVFFAGGKEVFAGRGASRQVDIYDPITEVWTTDTLSSERGAIMAIGAIGKVYFAGGIGGANGLLNLTSTKVIDIYDTETGTWSQDSLSEPRGAGAVVRLGNLLLFAGGLINDDLVSKRVDIYNLDTDTWTMDSLSVARKFLAGASDGRRAYFAGGSNNVGAGENFSTVDVYDGQTGNWSITNLSEARDGLAGAYTCGKVFFAGGGASDWTQRFITRASKRVDILDTLTGEWSTLEMNTDRYSPLMTAVQDQVIIGSGYNTSSGVNPNASLFSCPVTATRFSVKKEWPTFNIAPNPGSRGGIFFVPEIRREGKQYQFELYDMLGRLIEKGKVSEVGTFRLWDHLPGRYELLFSTHNELLGRAALVLY